jgi:hypothetical protein
MCVHSGFAFKQSKFLPLCSTHSQPFDNRQRRDNSILYNIRGRGGGVFIFIVLTLVELYR